MLLALWLLATVDGVGKARQLDRLCREHDAYRWLRGGVPVNYHLLADFRVGHQKELDELMSQILAAMMSTGLVTLRQVAQDGMRVRASAGSGSFRRKQRLEEYLEEARSEVARLAKERDCPETPSSRTAGSANGESSRRPEREQPESGVGAYRRLWTTYRLNKPGASCGPELLSALGSSGNWRSRV